MIDTIVMRFHGILSEKTGILDKIKSTNLEITNLAVDEHHQLYKSMLQYKHRFFNMIKVQHKEITSVSIDNEEDFLLLNNSKFKNAFKQIKQVMQFTDADNVKEVNLRVNGNYAVPSSTSQVTFSINENGGYIDFNLSIPKYLFGHSLAEFIPQSKSKRYMQYHFELNDISKQRELIHERLMKFVDLFLGDLSQMFKLDTIPNKDYIEIRRVDLCYNQHFDNKADALNYLHHQKKIVRKKSRSSGNRHEVYQTSLTYFTSHGSYFKIYHKGSEYIGSQHGDIKKHNKINQAFVDSYFRSSDTLKEDDGEQDYQQRLEAYQKVKTTLWDVMDRKVKDKPITIEKTKKLEINNAYKSIYKILPFKVNFLKEQMDKILRYELSLSGDFFQYNYKRKIFRSKDEEFTRLKENYKNVHKNLYDVAIENKEKISKIERKEYKLLHDYFNRGISLMLSNNTILKNRERRTPQDNKFDNSNLKLFTYRYTLLSAKDVGTFSKRFLNLCFKKFMAEVNSFQLKKLENYETVQSRIKQHNIKVEERRDTYNQLNRFRCFDSRGNRKIKGNRVIMSATQLLTQGELTDRKLKKVNVMRLLQIVREMQQNKKSLHQIRDSMNIEKSTFSRLKKDLEMFQIFEGTLEMESNIEPVLDYRDYYSKTQGILFSEKFYYKSIHQYYG